MPPLLDERFWQDIRQGLTDAGNRGIVGGTLGMPVDLAAGVINAALMSGGYLGNKLGLLTADQMPQPIEHPVGGSEWLGQKMQDAGMVSENRNPVAETLVGLLGPSAISKGGQAAWAMEQNAAKPSLLNDAARGQLGAIVYHGSPHKFDRFDMSKIGTGEGAQAYGHGMYFAENPGVAKSYQDALAPAVVDGRPFNPNNGRHVAAGYMSEFSGNTAAAIKDIDSRLARLAGAPESERSALETAKSLIQKGDVPKYESAGSLYKVDLPDEHIAKMLDWDKPLSQQPKVVRDAAEKLGVRERVNISERPDLGGFQMVDSIGSDLVDAATRKMGKEGASEYLKALGIPGIRYFDGVSRAKGEGSYNYVIFDADLAKIIGKE